MTIVELLERNAREWPDDTALIEINPDQPETRRVTWHDFELVEPSVRQRHYRREITWAVFNEKANRVANMLRSHNIGKGRKGATKDKAKCKHYAKKPLIKAFSFSISHRS